MGQVNPDPPLGWYGYWYEVTNDPTGLFINTQLYTILLSYFSVIGHTHTISDITNLQTTLDGKANSSHSHNAWVDGGLNDSVFTLFVNADLNMCELRMSYFTSAATGTADHSVSTTSIPSAYRPSGIVVGSLQVGGSLRVNNNGNIAWRTSNSVGSSTYIYGTVIWHY